MEVQSLPSALASFLGRSSLLGADVVPGAWQLSNWRQFDVDGHVLGWADRPELAAGIVARSRWLGRYLPVPAVKQFGQWVLFLTPPGVRAAQADQHREPGELTALVGAALREVHQLAPTECPFDETDQQLADLLTAAASNPKRKSADLPDPYCRYTFDQLQQYITESKPQTCDWVVGLGAPSLADFRFHSSEFVAVIPGPLAGRCDRNTDLAWLQRSISEQFGHEAVFGLFDGYGPGESIVAIDHYYLASIVAVET